jgi:hypothetical protein
MEGGTHAGRPVFLHDISLECVGLDISEVSEDEQSHGEVELHFVGFDIKKVSLTRSAASDQHY